MVKYNNILLTQEERVVTVTFNTPEKFNTFNLETWQELEHAVVEIAGYDDVGAVLVNANGNNYSAGIDVNLLQQVSSDYVLKNLPWLQSIYDRWEALPVPVITCVQGVCYGAAVEFILTCDLRVAGRSTHFCLPEVRLGLSPDMGGTARLTKLVGAGQARRLAIACDDIDGEEAKTIGLVQYLVEDDQLNRFTLKLAKRISKYPPLAVRMAKKAINVAEESSLKAALQFEQTQSFICCGSEDIQEGIGAFLEKRKPTFRGK